MHGRPRQSLVVDPARQKDEEAKIANLQSLLAEVLRNHRDRSYSKRALQQNARLLELNPEVYTAWNYRKLAVNYILDSEPDENARKNVLEEELQVVERALKRNHKSYGAWHHRRWVIQFGLSSLDREFQLLDKLLTADPRNFHGWAYRRFVVGIKKVTEESELQYTIKKINENFSNYSAWHNRSVLLSKQFKDKFLEKDRQYEILTEEFELVKQAFFTEPEDQSGWFYLMWLLSQTVRPSGPLLTAFWPLNGSLVIFNFDVPPRPSFWSFKTPLRQNFPFHSPGLCMAICFSDPVLGVDLTTAPINTSPMVGGVGYGLSWRPLSDCPEGSRIWTADLIAFSNHLRDVDLCTIHIEVGAAPGIISKDGAFSGVNQISFLLQLQATPNDMSHNADIMDSCISWPVERDVCSSHLEQLTKDEASGFLLKKNKMPDTVPVALLEAQIDTCRELLDLENDSKWAKLMLARLLMAHDNIANFVRLEKQHTDEVRQLFKDLMMTDPTHRYYYDEQLSLLSMDQISSNVQELCKHLLNSQESEDGNHGWLRLDHLSLSKLGFADRLIWVQKLDLSHNQLKSLEGLEPLQCLIWLDVSHNLLSTATALAPIRFIKNLQSINIRHNNVGGYTIDTHRYLFESALNNSQETTADSGHSLPIILDSWELVAVFRGMRLRQLEIFGNPIANDDMCKRQIIKALPSLVWLDQIRVCR